MPQDNEAGDPDEAWRALTDSEERHRLLAEHANDVIWTMSVDGRITYVSPAVERMRGFTPAEAMAQPIEEIHPPGSRELSLGYFVRLYELLERGERPEEFRGELEYLCRDGSTVWTDVQVIPHLDESGALVEILGVSRDISERKRYEAELKALHREAEEANAALVLANEELGRLATTDAGTGAWNRRYFEDVAARALAERARYRTPLTMLMIDVDNFKGVNDTWGHQVGDAALAELTARLHGRLRATDLLARWGGEEFVVLMPHTDIEAAALLAEDLRTVSGTEPFAHGARLTISVGVAEARDDDDLDRWLRRADAALYEAKESGRDAVRMG